MFLLFMIVSCALLGSSAGYEDEEECYGRHFRLPFRYTPPSFKGQLYFTPSRGGPRRLVMENGEAKDPKFNVSRGRVEYRDLRESDAGVFSVSYDGRRFHDVINLRILDCADKISKYYGLRYVFDVPKETEYIEFSPLSSKNQIKVLWNRTDPEASEGGRGEMTSRGWEITSVTQKDSGYYNFRNSLHTLRSRILLDIRERTSHHNISENERLFIQNPFGIDTWVVSFTHERNTKGQDFMKNGILLTYLIYMPFRQRIQVVGNGFEIDPVAITDSGFFVFRDAQGNVAQVVAVKVTPKVTPTYVHYAIAGGIVLAVVFCCCCVRKCCCKKSSSKRGESAPAAVYHHDRSQPDGPSNSAGRIPVNPPAYRKPAAASTGRSAYTPVNIHVNPLQPEAGAPGGRGASPAPTLGSNVLSTDTDPKFELKGLNFPCAPPLSSDSSFSHVYTSDKLNFL